MRAVILSFMDGGVTWSYRITGSMRTEGGWSKTGCWGNI